MDSSRAHRPVLPPVMTDDDHAALRFVQSGPEVALCTIVGIDGSFSRRLGAQLAIAPDSSMVGSLADGCLERELAVQARAMRGQGPSVLRYGKGSAFIDFRLPCGSGLDILIDPAPDLRAVGSAVEHLRKRQPAVLPLPIDRPGLLTRRTYIPSLKILIFGQGPEADCLQHLAADCGFDFETIGSGSGASLGQLSAGLVADEWTAIALLFHDHEWEGPILDWALSTPAKFIGAIGGKHARESRQAMLTQRGWPKSEIDRVRSPIGLIKRARDSRVMAISILAEIIDNYELSRSCHP